jgi:hypothetical protein
VDNWWRGQGGEPTLRRRGEGIRVQGTEEEREVKAEARRGDATRCGEAQRIKDGEERD